MNRWAQYLWQAPATLQRLIARHNRISLPRGCSADARLARLRAALIHQRTVRVTVKNAECRMQNAECRMQNAECRYACAPRTQMHDNPSNRWAEPGNCHARMQNAECPATMS